MSSVFSSNQPLETQEHTAKHCEVQLKHFLLRVKSRSFDSFKPIHIFSPGFSDEAEYAITQLNSLKISSKDTTELHELQARINFEKQQFPKKWFPQTAPFPHYRFNHLYEKRLSDTIW